MEQANRCKIQRKGVLTRHLKTLQRLTHDGSVLEVQQRLAAAKKTFEELEEFSDAHLEHLCREGDEDGVTEAEKWYDQVYDTYLKGVKDGNVWLKELGESKAVAVPPESSMDANAATSPGTVPVSTEIAALLTLPRLHVPVYSGDPSQYSRFISIFDEVIGDKLSDDKSKLRYLYSYLSGKAMAAVQHCDKSGGYLAARDILKKKFGCAYKICKAIVDNLRSTRSAFKPAELESLVDELRNAHATLLGMGELQQIDNQEFMKMVLARCHGQVQARWRRHGYDIHKKTGEYPKLVKLIEFLEEEAVFLAHPVYGVEEMKTTYRGHAPKTALCNSTDSKNVDSSCELCGNKHAIENCDKFVAMTQEQRYNVARKHRLCYRCLSREHVARRCPVTSLCGKDGCRGKHHVLLHKPYILNSVRVDADSASRGQQQGTQKPADVDVSTSQVTNQRVYLPIVPVMINNVYALALLDTGASASLITSSLVHRAGLSQASSKCKINSVGGTFTLATGQVSCRLTSMDRLEVHDLQQMFVVERLPTKVPGKKINFSEYAYLADLPLQHLGTPGDVEVLIGLDHPNLLRPLEIRCDPERPDAPYATRTCLGWSMQGPVVNEVSTCNVVVNCASLEQDEELKANIQDLTRIWEIENDHMNDENEAWSIQDRKVHEMWNEKVKLEHGHYEIPIPWKQENVSFPSNRDMAEKRLNSTIRKIENIDIVDKYHKEMDKMYNEGYSERVPDKDLNRDDGFKWYIPHFPVLNEAKPGKVRVVFDCAAQCNKVSFNSQCMSGPDLVNKLVHVLLRFRLYEYAFMADVKAMYMQVVIPEEQRDALRYLWFDAKGKIVEYRMTRHLFGGKFCAASSTFALRNVLNDFPASELVARAIRESFYVDDLCGCQPDLVAAREIAKGTQDILKKAGFVLTQYRANHSGILAQVEQMHCTQENKIIRANPNDKALGICWDVKDDVFTYDSSKLKRHEGLLTRRKLLSYVASLYDPVGLVLPCIIPGRLLFQEAARNRLGWDDPVDNDLRRRWDEWAEALRALGTLRFTRCIITSKYVTGRYELHHFCDSSQVAYGVCTYARLVSSSGAIRVTLVRAQGRIAPMKAISIPRLELCAAVLAAKSDVMIQKELHVTWSSSSFWTDSQIVLAYLRSESRRFKVFVANRVAHILRVSKIVQWKFIPTQMNPADIITRGGHPNALDHDSVWQNGPPFLHRDSSTWINFERVQETDSLEEEVIAVAHADCVIEKHPLDVLISHFSSFMRLIRAVAWLRKWIARMRRNKVVTTLTAEDLDSAQQVVCKHVQGMVYDKERESLLTSDKVLTQSTIRKLNPVIKGGLVCVGGRLRFSSIDEWAKFPIILPAKSKVAKLLLKHFHDQAHMGVEWSLAQSREKFWVPGARNELKQIRKQCVVCHRLYSKPAVQKMSDLPKVRTEKNLIVFSNVGLDVFGPFLSKVKRSTVKRYGCVFTCLSTRAIHIEMLHSLDTDSFINAFMRFKARRGQCKAIYCDNGTNFVGAKAEMQRAWAQVDKCQVSNRAITYGIDWHFNPPHASHFGGIWERMIRTIRKVFMAVTFQQALTDECISTAFCEVENLVNCRPITKVSDDPIDESPLTPNHLLLMQANFPVDFRDYAEALAHRKRWCLVQSIAASFWKRWVKEYMLLLQTRSKWVNEKRNLKVGELVLLVDEMRPRGSWPLGLVLETYKSDDGLVRSLRLKVGGSELVRPIVKVVPLECT